MARSLPKLSPAEWAIMTLCWRRGAATAREIYEDSLERQERGYTTVKTLLDRVTAKGYLVAARRGSQRLYTPVVRRRRAVARAIRDFVQEVLDDSYVPLFVHLAENENLSDDELDALRRLIANREGE